MVAFDIDVIFDAALNIQLKIEKNISLTFSSTGVSIKFPTTRRLAEYLDVPHYYVLPYFAMMEQEALVTRAERVGIMTTTRGTQKLIDLMSQSYRQETEALLGSVIFQELVRRVQEAPQRPVLPSSL
jgi:DNA-binding transcriptional regulator YhcF (GntR family)